MINLAQKYKQNCPNCTEDITPIMIQSKTIESGKRTTAARGDNKNIWIMACPECRLLFFDYQKWVNSEYLKNWIKRRNTKHPKQPIEIIEKDNFAKLFKLYGII